MILVIVSKDTGKTLERWVFNLEPHEGWVLSCMTRISITFQPTSPPNLDKIQLKIQATLKQLKATIPIFPDINEPTLFNLLAVTKDELEVIGSSTKEQWVDAHAHAIPAEVREQTALRGFNTKDTKLDMNVVYLDE